MRKQFAIYLLFIPFEGMLGWDRDILQKNDNDLLIRRCSLISLGDIGYIDKFPPRLGPVQHTIEHVYKLGIVSRDGFLQGQGKTRKLYPN